MIAWMGRAACRKSSVKPEWFFPSPGESDKRGKGVCARCPVVRTCRTYAIDDPNLRGVWGGLNDRERQRIRDGLDALLPPGHRRCIRCQQPKPPEAFYRSTGKCMDCCRDESAAAHKRRQAQRRQSAGRA